MNIWRSVFRRLRDDKGQSLVIVALAFVVLCGMVGLTFDIGNGYMQKQNLQAAADAGALAGASSLQQQVTPAGLTPSQLKQGTTNAPTADQIKTAEDLAKATARKNVSAAQYGTQVSGNQISVTAHKQVATFFAQLFGIKHLNVTVSAYADYNPVGAAKGVFPLGITASTMKIWEAKYQGHEISLTGDTNAAGNWGYLSPNDGISGWKGASGLKTHMEDGVSIPINVGDKIISKPGTDAGPAGDGTNFRISEDTSSQVAACQSYSKYIASPTACYRVVTVPIVDSFSNGRGTSTVVGFAKVFLNSYDGHNVYGYILKQVVQGETNPSAQNFGLDVVQLTNPN